MGVCFGKYGGCEGGRKICRTLGHHRGGEVLLGGGHCPKLDTTMFGVTVKRKDRGLAGRYGEAVAVRLTMYIEPGW